MCWDVNPVNSGLRLMCAVLRREWTKTATFPQRTEQLQMMLAPDAWSLPKNTVLALYSPHTVTRDLGATQYFVLLERPFIAADGSDSASTNTDKTGYCGPADAHMVTMDLSNSLSGSFQISWSLWTACSSQFAANIKTVGLQMPRLISADMVKSSHCKPSTVNMVYTSRSIRWAIEMVPSADILKMRSPW